LFVVVLFADLAAIVANLNNSLFVITELDNGVETRVGCGFFIQPFLGTTAWHVVDMTSPTARLQGLLSDGRTFPIAVTLSDKALDLAIVDTSPFEGTPVDIHPNATVRALDEIFCANFAIYAETVVRERQSEVQPEPQPHPCVAVWDGRVSSVTNDFFSISRAGAAGDSGAAIVLSRTGIVVGVYLEGVNEAEERKKYRRADVSRRVQALENSVDILTRNTWNGGIVLKISHVVQIINNVP